MLSNVGMESIQNSTKVAKEEKFLKDYLKLKIIEKR